MTPRDTSIDDASYFDRYIEQSDERIRLAIEQISTGELAAENVPLGKHMLFVKSLERLVGRFSMGAGLDDVKTEYSQTLIYMLDGWDEYLVKFKKGRQPVVLDKYRLNQYCYTTWMLSLADLLGASPEEKQQLRGLVVRDRISDEFLVGLARVDTSEPATTTYQPFSGLLDGNSFAEIGDELLDRYLASWFQKTRLLQWHRYRDSVDQSKYYYFGCWSFEAAAIVARFGLDDSKLRGRQHYPGDLVDHYRSDQTRTDQAGSAAD